MTSENLLQAMGYIDPQLIADAAPELPMANKAANPWWKWATAVACLLLIVSAAIGMSLLRLDEWTYQPISHEQLASPAPQSFRSNIIVASSTDLTEDPNLDPTGLSLTARLIEALPDSYIFYDDARQLPYRLLRMETVELVQGREMCDEFYYLIPEKFMTDFSIYDRFLICDMAQYTYEQAVMYNETQGKAERLALVVFGRFAYVYGSEHQCLTAFDAEGKFDSRLWNASQEWLALTARASAPASLQQAIADIQASERGENLYPHLLRNIQGEAKDVLEQITSFSHGIFVQDIPSLPPYSPYSLLHTEPEAQLHTTRYINGFATNERVSIFSCESADGQDSYEWSIARFGDVDPATLPDLPTAWDTITSDFAQGKLSPPHIQSYEAHTNTRNGIFAWYAKTDDGVIGVIRASWVYLVELPMGDGIVSHAVYFDDAYYIIESDSNTYEPIARDALIARLGSCEKTYIYTGEYDEKGMCYQHRDDAPKGIPCKP
ncbi:MAG: hypothetical protein IJY66_05915 [Clostridia bacterium]|nr:hypothetical protein [Clostridia bacterium]